MAKYYRMSIKRRIKDKLSEKSERRSNKNKKYMNSQIILSILVKSIQVIFKFILSMS